jgi:segregation and condensation protein A
MQVRQEAPYARVKGEPLTDFPADLYVPPDALEVFLEAFEGPLDLLLYLIKHNNLDILDIPIAEVTRQYMEYVRLMKALRLELAAEYLVMAAWLAELKSRLLLPRPVEVSQEQDPRAELVRRLQEYERYKLAAEALNAWPQLERDVFAVDVACECLQPRPLPPVKLEELVVTFSQALARAQLFSHHQVSREPLSVRERMSQILEQLQEDRYIDFTQLLSADEGRLGVVVTFLALLELVKEALIELVQTSPFGHIYVRVIAGNVTGNDEKLR